MRATTPFTKHVEPHDLAFVGPGNTRIVYSESSFIVVRARNRSPLLPCLSIRDNLSPSRNVDLAHAQSRSLPLPNQSHSFHTFGSGQRSGPAHCHGSRTARFPLGSSTKIQTCRKGSEESPGHSYWIRSVGDHIQYPVEVEAEECRREDIREEPAIGRNGEFSTPCLSL
jgi:hypothetical protein